MSQLLAGNQRLILGFNTFLPAGYEIEAQKLAEDECAGARSSKSSKRQRLLKVKRERERERNRRILEKKKGTSNTDVFIIGSRVEAKGRALEGGRKWYKGTVKAAKRDGSFCVVYDDDDTEDQIQQCNLRLLVDRSLVINSSSGKYKKETQERDERQGGEGSCNEGWPGWECEVCHDGGELLLCENCCRGFQPSRYYHLDQDIEHRASDAVNKKLQDKVNTQDADKHSN